MATPDTRQMTLSAEDLNDTDRGILDMLQEGRCTPRYIAGELDLQQPYVSQRLKRLVEHNHVKRIDRGLYQLHTDPREAEVWDSEPSQTSDEQAPAPIPEPAQTDTGPGNEGSTSEEPPPGKLADLAFPGTVDAEEAEHAVLAARDYLAAEGSASMRQIVSTVMAEHPLGYDVPDLEQGDRYRGAWWRKVVKPGLEALDDVEKPEPGQSEWRYTG